MSSIALLKWISNFFAFSVYLDGLCTLLYDTIRPYIIHINHLETLAEICSILRIEMIEEHVQQNRECFLFIYANFFFEITPKI